MHMQVTGGKNITLNRLWYSVALLLILAMPIGVFFLSGTEVLIWICLLIVGLCYHGIVTLIKKDCVGQSVFCDYRFYIFSIMLVYTAVTPVYGLLTNVEKNGIIALNAWFAQVFTSKELFETTIISVLFFMGILLGVKSATLRRKKKCEFQYSPLPENKNQVKKLVMGWAIVCIVSTLYWLRPFINGGFKAILEGGTIDSVDMSSTSRILDKFFGADMMVASTVALVFYIFQLNIKSRTRWAVIISILGSQCLLAFLTTRRGRVIAIILCVVVIYITWYVNQKKRLPIVQAGCFLGAIVFLYMLEVIMNFESGTRNLSDVLRLFDGVPAYDSLLTAVRENQTGGMLVNVVYGFFRPIPILGKHIVQMFGMDQGSSPLYLWMASHYPSIYESGGGLAYTPQLEAYLSGGLVAAFGFGLFYGIVFGKKREGLTGLFVIAMSFSIARGTTEVLMHLVWTYGIIGYYFYDRILFRKVRFGNQSHF